MKCLKNSKTNEIVPYRTFVLWDATLKDEDKQRVKFILNSPDNMEGRHIRVILGSPSIKEGVAYSYDTTIFEYNSGTLSWDLLGNATDMTGENNSDYAGQSVAISSDGTRVAVGEPGWRHV